MRWMNQKPPFFHLPKDGKHDCIEKYEMGWTFGQKPKPQNNGCRNPNEPRRFQLDQTAQPKNKRKTTEGDIERFDFNYPAFFYHSDVCHPNESADARSSRTLTGSR